MLLFRILVRMETGIDPSTLTISSNHCRSRWLGKIRPWAGARISPPECVLVLSTWMVISLILGSPHFSILLVRCVTPRQKDSLIRSSWGEDTEDGIYYYSTGCFDLSAANLRELGTVYDWTTDSQRFSRTSKL